MPMVAVTVCTFKREAGTQWEDGIALGHEPGVSDITCIVDSKGEPVPMPVWDYNLWHYKGTMNVELEGQRSGPHPAVD